MKIKRYITFIIVMCIANVALTQSINNTGFSIEKLQLEVRADFDANFVNSSFKEQYFVTQSGFNGKFLNFILNGQINEKFSYAYRQRVLPHKGQKTFFDGTDHIYLSYHPNKQFTATTGKMAIALGGFEYDAAPIDVYMATEFWHHIYCYQIGLNLAYTDKENKNTISFQFTNSPYSGVEYVIDKGFEQINSPIDNRFAYSLMWHGKYKYFESLYSVNAFKTHIDNKYIAYLCLGNRFILNKFSLYVDLYNKMTNKNNLFFKSYTLVSKADFKLNNSVHLFAKAGYDTNELDFGLSNSQISDIFVMPGEYYFYGLGAEFYFMKDKNLRLHSSLSVRSEKDNLYNISANIGLTWRMNFARLINKI